MPPYQDEKLIAPRSHVFGNTPGPPEKPPGKAWLLPLEDGPDLAHHKNRHWGRANDKLQELPTRELFSAEAHR